VGMNCAQGHHASGDAEPVSPGKRFVEMKAAARGLKHRQDRQSHSLPSWVTLVVVGIGISARSRDEWVCNFSYYERYGRTAYTRSGRYMFVVGNFTHLAAVKSYTLRSLRGGSVPKSRGHMLRRCRPCCLVRFMFKPIDRFRPAAPTRGQVISTSLFSLLRVGNLGRIHKNQGGEAVVREPRA